MNRYLFSVALTNGQRLKYTTSAISKAQAFRSVVAEFYNALLSIELLGVD